MIHTKKNANGYLNLHKSAWIKLKFKDLKIIISVTKKSVHYFLCFIKNGFQLQQPATEQNL